MKQQQEIELHGALLERAHMAFLETCKQAHLEYHGPGLTFGELAIGETFEWAAPTPRGPEPMRKFSDDTYGWSKGVGTAEGYYRVERA